MKVKYIEVKNLKIAYLDEGEGIPILILHGWLTSKECYIPLINQLKSNYRIITPDLPGFGDSEDFGKDYTFKNYLSIIKWISLYVSKNIIFLCKEELKIF